MKQIIKVLAAFFVIAAFAFVPPKHNIAGHWRISYSDGSKGSVVFTMNGTYKSYDINGKPVHEGMYKFNEDTVFINDKEGCGDTYWATYKVTFLGKDSAINNAIEDSCSGRKEAVNGAGLKRIKK